MLVGQHITPGLHKRPISAQCQRHVVQPRLSSRKPLGKLQPLSVLPSLDGVGMGFGGQAGSGRQGVVPASSTNNADASLVHGHETESFKEAGRKEMRTVFDFERWTVHRSNSRYFRHLLGMFQSRMVRGLAAPLVFVIGIAVAVGLYITAQQGGMVPAVFPSLGNKIKELFAVTSSALSLLLVFRTNASYGRWDEARKMWGVVLNRSRDMTIQGLTWIPEEKAELRDRLCRWIPAFAKVLMCHLRKGGDPAKELEGTLLPHEIADVMQTSHRPIYVLAVLSQIIKSAELPIPPTQLMMESLGACVDSMGGCERILRTPIPLFYTRHTSRFMMIWVMLLPLTLFPTCGWATVPMSGIIAFLLLGIEEIGVSIEEPFSILALETLTNTIQANVVELQAVYTTPLSQAEGK